MNSNLKSMKCVILAGGLGTRLSELTESIPKPMVQLDDKPLLIHLMLYFSKFGVNDFIICAGYKADYVKQYFDSLITLSGDVCFDYSSGRVTSLNPSKKFGFANWSVSIIDTGIKTMTGGRLSAIRNIVQNQPFFMTYGDGLANVDLVDLLRSHQRAKKIATVTAVMPPGRFGSLVINSGNLVTRFAEKPAGDNSWINGGFFVLSPEVFDYIGDDSQTVFEESPLENLARNSELNAYKHSGFWQPMDTLRDVNVLRDLIQRGIAPWV